MVRHPPGIPWSATPRGSWALSVRAVTLGGMDNTSDVLLLHAVQEWCDVCMAERILVPVVDDLPGGLCCTVCDTAAFGELDDLPSVAALRRSA